jgi:hypothetical protein
MLKSQDYMPFLLQSFDQLDSTHIWTSQYSTVDIHMVVL